MKKAVAMVMAVMMMLAFSVSAFAANEALTAEQAKQAALDYAGVNASEAIFTKAYRDYENGRQVYEIEFYVGNTEYDMNVDVYTGRVTDFSTEYHGAYGSFNSQQAGNMQPGYGQFGDCDDMYDFDWDDRYDHDFDDWFDWDD